MATRNIDVLADKRIEFRVGVNLGDIIIDEDDIFGDGSKFLSVDISDRRATRSASMGLS